MSIYGTVLPGASLLGSLARRTEISREAKKRLRWFDYYRKAGNARLTLSVFWDFSPDLLPLEEEI